MSRRNLNMLWAVILILISGNWRADLKAFVFEPHIIDTNANLWWARAIGDINGDGLLDVVLQDNNAHGGWLGWYEAQNKGKNWKQHIIAPKSPKGETFASGDLEVGDIDNDGDIDIIGLEHTGEWDNDGEPTGIYWYENPTWQYHAIGEVPACIKDLNVVDFNGDKKLDIVTISYARHRISIFRQNTPTDWVKAKEFKIANLHEGMDVGDIDGDGDPDVATNGYWLENPGGDLGEDWQLRTIDEKWHNQTGDWSKNATKIFCRDITGDGRVEVFISHSERNGYPISWYESADPRKGQWKEHVICKNLPAAHTLQVFDMDGDGDYDVVTGVNKNRARDLKIKSWPVLIFLNKSDNLTWQKLYLTDQGIYNGQVGDLEGDGDMDIFRLPTHDAKTFEVLIQESSTLSLEKWKAYQIDQLPERGMFVEAGDLDGDGKEDVAAGGWWWKNPGQLSGKWTRNDIGKPLNNIFILDDFDKDADLDVIGTEGTGANANHKFVWACNNGEGNFDIHTNIETGGSGDFLQGRAVADFGGGRQIMLSWHNGGGGIQALNIPDDPLKTTWPFNTMSTTTEKEDLSLGDIDRDGDLDILLGLQWLRNDVTTDNPAKANWTLFTLGEIADLDGDAEPDRNDLADINGDGRLDAVVGLENGKYVLWFEAPEDPTKGWTRHVMGKIAGQGFSMDTADFDSDGDPDVVLGEHRGKTQNRVVIFENQNHGAVWNQKVIHTEPKDVIDHHDGAQAVDLDHDGDLDIISIGWYNPKVWVFENQAVSK